MVSHESVVNTLDFEIGLRRKRGLGEDDPCIQMMSIFADMSGALGLDQVVPIYPVANPIFTLGVGRTLGCTG